MRGAYMYLERDRAAKKGYSSPIWPSIEQTHANYDRRAPLFLPLDALHEIFTLPTGFYSISGKSWHNIRGMVRLQVCGGNDTGGGSSSLRGHDRVTQPGTLPCAALVAHVCTSAGAESSAGVFPSHCSISASSILAFVILWNKRQFTDCRLMSPHVACCPSSPCMHTRLAMVLLEEICLGMHRSALRVGFQAPRALGSMSALQDGRA